MHESFKQGAPAELWQALVREAGQRIAQPLDESREHYLVFVLLRLQRDAQLFSRTQALAWLHAQDQIGSLRADALRDIGDQCLLIAGLFPGIAQRRRLSVDYFIELAAARISKWPTRVIAMQVCSRSWPPPIASWSARLRRCAHRASGSAVTAGCCMRR